MKLYFFCWATNRKLECVLENHWVIPHFVDENPGFILSIADLFMPQCLCVCVCGVLLLTDAAGLER